MKLYANVNMALREERALRMYVQAAEITLYAPAARTLKDKRQILRSLIDQVRHQFNAAIAEVDAQDLCQRIVVGVACVSSTAGHARQQLEAVVRFIEENAAADILDVAYD